MLSARGHRAANIVVRAFPPLNQEKPWERYIELLVATARESVVLKRQLLALVGPGRVPVIVEDRADASIPLCAYWRIGYLLRPSPQARQYHTEPPHRRYRPDVVLMLKAL